MAIATKRKNKKKKSFKSGGNSRDDFILPAVRSVIAEHFEDYTTLIHGFRKIGKTSLASMFENSLIMEFEPGSKALEVFSVKITDWDDFRGYIKSLERKKAHKFRNVVIDTGDACYNRCFEYGCYHKNVKHPNDAKDYGATWKFIRQEFEEAHTRIMNMGLGLVVLAHSQEKEFEDRNGDKTEKIVPILSKAADEYYAGVLDSIFYYGYRGGQRFLQVRGNESVIAGTRCASNNFRTPKGIPIARIPMGNSKEQSYRNLVGAFNNHQLKTFESKKEKREREEWGEEQLSSAFSKMLKGVYGEDSGREEKSERTRRRRH